MAIQMYGYSWLRPPGCSKTMLGRREEEVEKEEVERQLREAEEGEERAMMMEEMSRQQQLQEAAARGEEGAEEDRDLDEEIPDADPDQMDGDEDLDDELPEADDNTNIAYTEGETGITDDVEHTNLGDAAYVVNEDDDQEVLANVMLDEDEQGMAERDLDEEIPDVAPRDEIERDQDDVVPEAADNNDAEGEWQHTDTELEEEDESRMNISLVQEVSNRDTVDRPQGSLRSRWIITPVRDEEVQRTENQDVRWQNLPHPAPSSIESARGRFFEPGRNMFGGVASNLSTPPTQGSRLVNTRRSSARLHRGAGRENASGARDSLD